MYWGISRGVRSVRGVDQAKGGLIPIKMRVVGGLAGIMAWGGHPSIHSRLCAPLRLGALEILLAAMAMWSRRVSLWAVRRLLVAKALPLKKC